jgi:hypothetical chaperone protein
LLAKRDIMSFLRDIRGGSLGPNDKLYIDQLICLVEDAVGFQVFEAIEHTKRALSASPQARFSFDYPGIEIGEEITRADFQDYSAVQANAILSCLDRTISDSGLRASDIDLVCATGGTAKVKFIAEGIAARFPSEKQVKLRSLHSVIQGLAERARAYA